MPIILITYITVKTLNYLTYETGLDAAKYVLSTSLKLFVTQ